MEEKKQLRNHAKDILSFLSKQDREYKSREISKALSQLLNKIQSEKTQSESLRIGSYNPIQKEVLWHLEWQIENAQLFFPKINTEDKTMIFCKAMLDELSSDWGITIPDENAREVEDNLDVLIVPGLLFTKKGERLGRGAGYYDRYLANSQALKIAVCFEMQLKDHLVTDDHDCLMDYIITEQKIYKRG